jgi:hypothetical protein
VLDALLPAAHHVTEQYANNRIEADHGRLKSRLRPMRRLKRLRSARVISTGHAFVQNLRRGHYGLGVDADPPTSPRRRVHRTRSRHLNPTPAKGGGAWAPSAPNATEPTHRTS